MDEVLEQTRLALPGNRGIFTHPKFRPRTVGASNGGRRSRYGGTGMSSGSNGAGGFVNLAQVRKMTEMNEQHS